MVFNSICLFFIVSLFFPYTNTTFEEDVGLPAFLLGSRGSNLFVLTMSFDSTRGAVPGIWSIKNRYFRGRPLSFEWW